MGDREAEQRSDRRIYGMRVEYLEETHHGGDEWTVTYHCPRCDSELKPDFSDGPWWPVVDGVVGEAYCRYCAGKRVAHG